MRYLKTYEEIKPIYNANKFLPFVTWFNNIHKSEMEKEGWFIVNTAYIDIPEYINTEYYTYRNLDYWQIQRNDDADILKSDKEAEELAKKKGLLIDEYGILIGYNGVSFIKHPEELETYKNVNKYNL